MFFVAGVTVAEGISARKFDFFGGCRSMFVEEVIVGRSTELPRAVFIGGITCLLHIKVHLQLDLCSFQAVENHSIVLPLFLLLI